MSVASVLGRPSSSKRVCSSATGRSSSTLQPGGQSIGMGGVAVRVLQTERVTVICVQELPRGLRSAPVLLRAADARAQVR